MTTPLQPHDDNTPAVGMLSMDLNGKIVSGNKMFTELLGYTDEEVLQQTLHTITHPDDLEQEILLHGNLQKHVTARFVNKRFIHKNRTVIPVHSITTFARNRESSFLCVFVPQPTTIVTAPYDETFQHLVRELEEYAMFKIDATGKIVSWNQGVEWNFGYNEAEFIGKPYDMLFTEADKAVGAVQREMHQARKNGSAPIGRYSMCKDLNQIHTIGTIKLLKDTDGNTDGFIIVMHDDTMRKQAEESLAHVAYHDALTGLPNRQRFKEKVGLALSLARRTPHKAAILYIDIDNFKKINDEYGHIVGDLMLKELSKRLRNVVRTEDVVARIGGDEFVVLLPKITTAEEASAVAEKIRHAFTPVVINGFDPIQFTASIGISTYPDNGKTTHDLVHLADSAMYRAKRAGGNSAVQTGSEDRQP